MKTFRQLVSFFLGILCIFSHNNANLSLMHHDLYYINTYKNIIKKICATITVPTVVIGTYLYNKSHDHQECFCDGNMWSTFGNIENQYLLHLHGWGAHANKRNEFVQNHFFMASPRFEETMVKKLYRSYFGQSQDVLQALITLKETIHHIKDSIFTIAYSRGAAVFINLIAVLCQKNHPLLLKSGITEEQRIFFLNCFKKGRTVLLSPLISMRATLEYRFTKYFGGIFGHYIFLPLITGLRYKPNSFEPIQMLNVWDNDQHIPLWIIFPKEDNYIGTALRKEFIQKLFEKNTSTYTKICIIDDNKHLSKKLFKIAENILLKKQI